jgi:type IV pilus assembly protein PilC
MPLFPTLPVATLIDLCRTLRHTLGAGLSPVDIFRQQAGRGPGPLRTVADEIRDLERGATLEAALRKRDDTFPPLFLALTSVGERSGNLPEVFGELERYYLLQQRLRREFTNRVAGPVLQFVSAVLIVAAVIWIISAITSDIGEPIDPLGVGLTGLSGAIAFALLAYSIPIALIGLCLFLLRAGRGATVAEWFLRVPVFGPCLRAIALARLCLALRLTLDSGMPIGEAVGQALNATGNPAFVARVPQVQASLRKGNDLTSSLAGTGLLPLELENVLAVAEESGQVPEVLRGQAEHYQEETERRLGVVVKVLGFLIWLFVAAFVVWLIFRLFLNVYLAPLSGLGILKPFPNL